MDSEFLGPSEGAGGSDGLTLRIRCGPLRCLLSPGGGYSPLVASVIKHQGIVFVARLQSCGACVTGCRTAPDRNALKPKEET